MTRSDVFRAGDVLNGYRLLEDFRVVGAGLSEWSFAERGGRTYFIKRFLSPTYPDADAPGSELVKRTELGYTTKLIDFDSSYIAGNPPPPEEIVGTMNYYSPELVRYIQGSAAPGELTEAADIFALGLIYAEYLTGAMPPFDPAHHEPAIAVLHGQPLKLGPSRTPTSIIDLIERMLLADPATRP